MRNAWIKTLALIFILALGLAACASSPETGSLPQTGGNETSGNDVDELFINMMVPHHQGAVEMAHTALERSERPEIRQMAEAIIAGQDAEIEQMRAYKQEWYGSSDTPPMSEMPSMHPMPEHGAAGHAMDMQAEVDALRNAPEPFDLAFIDAMIPHHQSAIDAAEEVRDSAAHPELRSLAEAIITAQRQEIDQMLAWRAEWFPEAPTPSPQP